MSYNAQKRILAVLLLLSLVFLTACGKKEVKKQSIWDIIQNIEKTESAGQKEPEYGFALLPWGTKKADVMKIQGWSEEDLEEIYYQIEGDSETLTKKLPVEELNAEVRIYCYWYGEGELGGIAYFLYFDEKEPARDCYEKLFSAYQAVIPEDIAGGNDLDLFTTPLRSDYDMYTEYTPSHLLVKYIEDSRENPIPHLGIDEKQYYVVFVEGTLSANNRWERTIDGSEE